MITVELSESLTKSGAFSIIANRLTENQDQLYPLAVTRVVLERVLTCGCFHRPRTFMHVRHGKILQWQHTAWVGL